MTLINKWCIFWAILLVLFIIIALVLPGCALFSTQSTPDVLILSPGQQMWRTVAKTNWFGTFCLLSFFGGVVAVGLDQRKIGSAVIIAAISTICLGLAIHRFPLWLAIIGFAGSVIAAGYSILIKNKALVEIIKGTQRIKNYAVKQLKGNREGFNRILQNEQSGSTEKIVGEIKVKEKLIEKGSG